MSLPESTVHGSDRLIWGMTSLFAIILTLRSGWPSEVSGFSLTPLVLVNGCAATACDLSTVADLLLAGAAVNIFFEGDTAVSGASFVEDLLATSEVVGFFPEPDTFFTISSITDRVLFAIPEWPI